MIRASQSTIDQVASLSTVWAVMEAARAGAADARAAAQGFVPAVAKTVAGGLHATGFALGYSVTFPACLLARMLPQNNAIVFGFKDGGKAGLDLARSTVLKSSVVSAEPPLLTIAAAGA